MSTQPQTGLAPTGGATYATAFPYVMGWEDPKHECLTVPDAGGTWSISGINSKDYPQQFQEISFTDPDRRMPLVAQFYRVVFWQPMALGLLNYQDLANRVLDEGVNTGYIEGIEMLQRTINLVTGDPLIVVDGAMGPLTAAAANACVPLDLLNAYRAARANYYKRICTVAPNDSPAVVSLKLSRVKYLPQWLTRAAA